MADVTFTTLEPSADPGARFQRVRRELGVESFGINLMTLQPGDRGRVHIHQRQEEVYVVLEGELTLLVDDDEHTLGRYGVARVPGAVRRQLVNRGTERLVVLALGGSGRHDSRDALAWDSWDDGGPGRPPS